MVLAGRDYWAPLLAWVNRAMVGVYVQHEDLDSLTVVDRASDAAAEVLTRIRRECAHELGATRAVG